MARLCLLTVAVSAVLSLVWLTDMWAAERLLPQSLIGRWFVVALRMVFYRGIPVLGAVLWSLLVGAVGVWVVHNATGMCGRELWGPAGVAVLFAVTITLVAAMCQWNMVPPSAVRVVPAGVSAFVIGTWVGTGFCKELF
mgnify:CR=1 FL=1